MDHLIADKPQLELEVPDVALPRPQDFACDSGATYHDICIYIYIYLYIMIYIYI